MNTRIAYIFSILLRNDFLMGINKKTKIFDKIDHKIDNNAINWVVKSHK